MTILSTSTIKEALYINKQLVIIKYIIHYFQSEHDRHF